MKPYFYILAVLLAGGSIGYFIGQRVATPTVLESPPGKLPSDDRRTIETLLSRLKEAYAAHDEFSLFRDCAASYVEVNASTGESLNLQRAIIRYHELFRPGKSVSVHFENIDVSLMQRSALVRATYSKTSDHCEQQGFAGLTGQVLWLLSQEGERWQVVASLWTEEKKR